MPTGYAARQVGRLREAGRKLSLLGRLAVDVFVVGLRLDAGMVDDAVPVIGGAYSVTNFNRTLLRHHASRFA